MSRYTSQEVCPWNEKFSQPLGEDAFRPREAIARKDAAALARDILAMTDEDFRIAFKGSPMKRAKLRGLKRNAAVVLGNIADDMDLPALQKVLEDSEPIVRDHAAWAISRVDSVGAVGRVPGRSAGDKI